MDTDPILYKGLFVSADGPVIVHCVLYTTSMGVVSAYLALPEESLDLAEHEYYVTSPQASGNLEFILVGTQDNTFVAITIPLDVELPPNPHDRNSETVPVRSGTSYKITLNRL